MTKHNWVGKVIHWELCKELKPKHATKWYIHNPESVLDNETHKILWGLEIQTDHLILARRPDLETINTKKRICRIVNFVITADQRMKIKENKRIDKYLDLTRELKKQQNMRVAVIPIAIDAIGTVP